MVKRKQIEIGDVFPTNEGGSVTVIEYHNALKVSVKHNDNHSHVTDVRAGDLRKGEVKNPYYPSVFGVGFIGIGEYATSQERGNKSSPAYTAWSNMLQRCYCPKYHAKKPSYVDCVAHEDWHNFQNFAKWYEQQYRADGWQLDKDLIIEGNKLYSADTCALIPHQLNNLMLDRSAMRGDLPIGVSRNRKRYQAELSVDGKKHKLGIYDTPEEAFEIYKFAKEANVRRMAEKYRGLINSRVYEALINYEVKA